ncbi:MAG TPA: CsgG/HfaB family protein [Gammaproteobacteria bacterium]|nr:CsgG/HfaB family protein [Gammaproteobacteria bacterium]
MFLNDLHISRLGTARLLFVTAVALGLSGCMTPSQPHADNSVTTHRLASLPPPNGPAKKVTIYQFTSSVPEVGAQAATDMFTTALVKSHRFAVLERQRLSEGVLREKQMNSQGMTTGNVGQTALAGADYIFHGTVSEANANASSNGVGATVRGLGVETSGAKAVIAVDVRVVDAHNGAVLDAVDVRRAVKQGGVGVSGIGSFLQSFTKTDLQGADASVHSSRKEGVDRALRECIEEAVYQVAKRFGN